LQLRAAVRGRLREKPSFLFGEQMTSNANFKIELAANLSLTEMEGKLVLFSKSNGDFFGLNESAGFFLKLLLENDFLKTVALAQQDFEVSETIVKHDILELVDELVHKKLIKKITI